METFKKIKRYQRITIFTLIVIMVISIAFINSGFIWHTNITKNMEKMSGKPLTVKRNIEYLYKGKKYKIVLGTPKDKKDELYESSFEEKFGGLLYKPSYGAGQGGSKSLYNFVSNFIGSSNENFMVVYGYNKDLKASNFSVQKTNGTGWITEDISNQEYFLFVYTDIVYAKIIFRDSQNNDITSTFIGK